MAPLVEHADVSVQPRLQQVLDRKLRDPPLRLEVTGPPRERHVDEPTGGIAAWIRGPQQDVKTYQQLNHLSVRTMSSSEDRQKQLVDQTIGVFATRLMAPVDRQPQRLGYELCTPGLSRLTGLRKCASRRDADAEDGTDVVAMLAAGAGIEGRAECGVTSQVANEDAAPLDGVCEGGGGVPCPVLGASAEQHSLEAEPEGVGVVGKTDAIADSNPKGVGQVARLHREVAVPQAIARCVDRGDSAGKVVGLIKRRGNRARKLNRAVLIGLLMPPPVDVCGEAVP